MSRTQRSIWTFVSSIVNSAATLLTGLVSVPLLLGYLGDEQFGAFRTLVDWQALLGLIELGFAQAVRTIFAEAFAGEAEFRVGDVFAYTSKIYWKVAGVSATATLILAAVAPWVIQISEPYVWDLRIGVLCFLPLCWVLPLNLYLYAADARQRGYWINFGLTIQALLIVGLSLLFAAWGGGIISQCVAFMLGHLFLPIAARFALRESISAHSHEGANSPETLEAVGRKLSKLNYASVLMQITGKVGQQTDKILVAFLLGAPLVVPFFTTYRLIQLAQHQVLMLGSSSWAALAELYHQGEGKRFNERLVELTSFTSVVALAFCISTGVFAKSFVRLWVGEEQFGGWLLVLAAVVIGYVHPVIAQWKWAFGATGHSPLLVRLNIYWVVVNVGVSVGATYLWGLAGPLIGTAFSTTFVLFCRLPYMLERQFDTPSLAAFGAALKPLLLGIPYAAIIWWLAQFRPEPGWIELALWMAGTAGIYLLACWFLIWDAEIRDIWKRRLGTILRLPQRKAA